MKLIINKVTAFMATLAISIVTHAATAPSSGQTYYGLFVGVNEYSNGVSSLFGCDRDVVNMLDAYTASGFCDASNAVAFLDYAATKGAVRAKFNELAGKAKSGDVVLYYQSSHGGDYDGDKGSCLCMADDNWSDVEFAEDLEKFVSGVRVVVIIDACYSGGMFKAAGASSRSVMRKRGFSFAARVQRHLKSRRESRKGTAAKGGVSVGWITACDWDELSTASPFGSIFTNAIIDGWRDGSADVDSDGYVSFSELAGYALDNVDYDEYGQTTQLDNDGLLSSVLAGRVYDMSVSHPLVLDKVFYGFIGTCPASVSIPAGIERIAESAFDADYNDVLALESVTIPASVTEIGACAFYECVNLVSVTFAGDRNAVFMGEDAFYNTPYFETLPFRLLIDDGWLYGFEGAIPSEIVIPDTVWGIAESVFDADYYDMEALTSVTIPESVEEVGQYAFYGCDNLETVTFEGDVADIWFEGGLSSVFFGTPWLEANCPVPANDDFENAISMSEAMEGSVVGTNIFATIESNEPLDVEWDAISTVWWKWTAPDNGPVQFNTFGSDFDTILGVYTGESIDSLTLIDDNDDAKDSEGYQSQVMFNAIAGTTYYIVVGGYEDDGEGNISLNWGPYEGEFSFVVEDGVLKGFNGICPESITIPDDVVGIGEGALMGIVGLRGLYIPASVTYIGESAFEDCTDLEEVIFEEKEPELIEWEWTDDDNHLLVASA